MSDRLRPASIEDLPVHLILDILTSGRLTAADLACLELSTRAFTENLGFFDPEFNSLVHFAAFQLCGAHPVYVLLDIIARDELFARCGGNWKKVLRFLQCVEQSSSIVDTSSSNMQIKTGRYHTLLMKDSSVYSCGSSLCGVLGHGPDTTQCVAFRRINFPTTAPVVHISASHNHAAFVMKSGEVFTCGDNSSFCCGHSDTRRPIFRPRLVEALKDVPCIQVAAGLNFTMFLSREGHVYTCGNNTYGQLGHGDTLDRKVPTIVERLVDIGRVVQISAGPIYALAVLADGTVYSFGYANNFCLGHGELQNENEPRAIQWFRRNGIHIVRVCAGDEHVVALDSSGYVYTWGKGYCGALGHGEEIDKSTPELLTSLKNHVAVQVCASKRKTFVLVDNGSLYGFGWMGFGSLGFPDKGLSEKVVKPCILGSLRSHNIAQVSTGLYHSVVVTKRGQVFGFGDNERAQLGHDHLRSCPEPTEIFVPENAIFVAVP